MSKSPKTCHYLKLLLFITFLFCLGLVSCKGDKGSSYEGWKYVGDVRDEKGQHVSVYINVEDMLIEGNIRKFWIRYYAAKNGSDEKYIRQIGMWEVNCNDGALYVLGEEYYGDEGQVLGRVEERTKEDYKEDSLGTKLVSSACRYAGR